VSTRHDDPDRAVETGAEISGLPARDAANVDAARDVVELAATEFLEKLRGGVHPAVEEFAQRFPEHADEIREVLPLVASMELWKANREAPAVGQSILPTLGLKRFGDYRMIREIGRGGMGVVCEAVHESNGRRVAIKFLPSRFPGASHWREQFLAEARITARLRHPNIVTVHEFGEQEGWCYYVMKLVEGLSLDRIIRLLREPDGAVNGADIQSLFATGSGDACRLDEPGVGSVVIASKRPDPREPQSGILRRDDWRQIALIGAQAAGALRYAHGLGTLHRDVKPANLLLDRQGVVWLADFGIASRKDEMLRNAGGHFGGTLAYLAPEQIDGQVDERSDVYSLGATLFELCTLRPAFAETDRMKLLQQVRSMAPPPPRSINPRMPRDLDGIIVKAMSRDPARRYQSAGEMLAALEQFLQRPAASGSTAWWRRWLRLLWHDESGGRNSG
jgi:serine/threonine protein kinase